jgi:hypothetical protein
MIENLKSSVNNVIRPQTFVGLMLALMATVIGGVIFMSVKLGSFDARLVHVEKGYEEFKSFKNVGDRLTRAEGTKLETKLLALENEMRTYPPEWFRADFKELKSDVRHLREVVELNKASLSVVKGILSVPQ